MNPIRKNILFYLTAFILVTCSFLFFTRAYRQIQDYTSLVERRNTVYHYFQDLSKQINNAAVLSPDLLTVNDDYSQGMKLFFTDSQTVMKQVQTLQSVALDSININIVNQLHKKIKAELSWLIKSNVPDSIMQHHSAGHIAALQAIDSLIDTGINRTNFLIGYSKDRLKNALDKERVYIILFIIFAGLLLVYTTLNLFKQKNKIRSKEKELEEANQLLKNAQRIGHMGNWKIDTGTKETYWSDEIYNIWNIAKEPYLFNYGAFIKSVHPEERELVAAKMAESFNGYKELDIEHRIILKNGTIKWIHQKGRLTVDQPGRQSNFEGTMQDITERKLTEIKLKQATANQYLFVSIVNSSDDAIISKSLDGIITSWNRGAERLLGYTDKEMIGEHISKIIPPHLLNEEAVIIARIKEGKYVEHFETERVKKDGSTLFVSLTVSPILDAKGNITGASKIARDITEKKQTEKAIEAVNNEKNIILESIDDAFFAVDSNWIVTYWNTRAEKILQKPKSEVTGHNLWDIFPESVGSNSYKKYQEAVETNTAIHFEDYYEPLQKWYEIGASPSGNGLSVYFKDITERKTSEIQLIELNKNLQDKAKELAQTVQELADYKFALDETSIVAITDEKGIIKYVNENFCKISKYSSDELVGQDHRIINSGYHPKEFIKNLWVTIANGKIWKGELKNKAKDGTIYWVDTTIVPFLNDKGKPYQYVAIRADITERKHSETHLNELNNDLQQQAKELERSNSELEQFAYVASHDLQEPLRMISSFLTQLEKKYEHILDEKGKRYIAFAVDGAKRMRQIILDLLEFSRVGKTEDKKELLDIDKLVKEILILFRKKVEEKHAKIFTEALPVMNAYKIPLYQVFQNLISNALKYAAAARSPEIKITAKELGTHWQFEVADNGIGIEEEYFDKIFVIFQRLHNKDEYAGTGMGLAITKKIVESLGGKIWLTSAEGKGSTFYFTIKK